MFKTPDVPSVPPPPPLIQIVDIQAGATYILLLMNTLGDSDESGLRNTAIRASQQLLVVSHCPRCLAHTVGPGL